MSLASRHLSMAALNPEVSTRKVLLKTKSQSCFERMLPGLLFLAFLMLLPSPTHSLWKLYVCMYVLIVESILRQDFWSNIANFVEEI